MAGCGLDPPLDNTKGRATLAEVAYLIYGYKLR